MTARLTNLARVETTRADTAPRFPREKRRSAA